MKVLFLDVDGVLNNEKTKERSPGGYIGIDERNLSILKEALDLLNQKEQTIVVLSSSWRAGVDRNGNRLSNQDYEYLLERLKSKDIFLYDETPILPGWLVRGKEIKKWLCEHQDLPITGMVILDDERHDFRLTGTSKFWLQTSYYNGNGGLNTKHLKWLSKILEKPIPPEFYEDQDMDHELE